MCVCDLSFYQFRRRYMVIYIDIIFVLNIFIYIYIYIYIYTVYEKMRWCSGSDAA